MAKAYDVLLVRHGESESNAVGRFAYHSWDPRLTETGLRQAERLAAQLYHAPIMHLVTSPLARAQETLAPLARLTGIEPQVVADLIEVNLGRWDGLKLSDLEQSEDRAFHAWRLDPEANPPPGGESILTVGHRVLDGLEKFVTSHDAGLTVAATHSDCIKGAVLVVTKSSGPIARALYIPNGGQLFLRLLPAFHRWIVVLNTLYYPEF